MMSRKASTGRRPSVACIHDYLEPVRRAQMLIRGLTELSYSNSESSLLDRTGRFVLAFAAFESMMSDLLEFHLLENPHLLPQENRTLPTEKIAESAEGRDILSYVVKDYIRKIMYKELEEILRIFGQKTTLGAVANQEQLKILVSAKNIRNAILHSNVHALKGKQNDLIGMQSIIEVCDKIEENIVSRFADHTRVASIKALWEYIFETPLLRPFENFFVIDYDRDLVVACKPLPDGVGLSNSERIFYEIWVGHFKGATSINNFHMRSLSGDKIFWFLSVLRRKTLWGEMYEGQ